MSEDEARIDETRTFATTEGGAPAAPGAEETAAEPTGEEETGGGEEAETETEAEPESE